MSAFNKAAQRWIQLSALALAIAAIFDYLQYHRFQEALGDQTLLLVVFIVVGQVAAIAKWIAKKRFDWALAMLIAFCFSVLQLSLALIGLALDADVSISRVLL